MPRRSAQKRERLCLGAHLSVAGGVSKAIERAQELGADALQIFTKNANRWHHKAIDPDEAARFLALRKRWGVHPVVSHDSYLINVASPDRPLREKSIRALDDELKRAELLGLDGLVMHPGAHVGIGAPRGIQRIAAALRRVLARNPRAKVRILLENTAGQGTVIGGALEELADLLEAVDAGPRVGLCLDTCHLYAAGYDLGTLAGYRATMKRLDTLIGTRHVRLWHLNDSRGALGSHLDRHQHIGQGEIGRAGFRRLLRDPRFFGIPKVLETPKAGGMDAVNLRLLYELG